MTHSSSRIVGWPCRSAPCLAAGAEARDKVRVVTTIPDLKSLTEAVGGDLVDVESLTRGTQNFHEAEVRPSMMLKLRRAELLIENGARARRLGRRRRAGREQRRHRPRRRAGASRSRAACRCWTCRGARVDRSMGDVHPLRQPALLARSRPGARSSPRTSSRGWPAWRPQHRAAFEKNRAAFLARLDEQMAPLDEDHGAAARARRSSSTTRTSSTS